MGPSRLSSSGPEKPFLDNEMTGEPGGMLQQGASCRFQERLKQRGRLRRTRVARDDFRLILLKIPDFVTPTQGLQCRGGDRAGLHGRSNTFTAFRVRESRRVTDQQ